MPVSSTLGRLVRARPIATPRAFQSEIVRTLTNAEQGFRVDPDAIWNLPIARDYQKYLERMGLTEHPLGAQITDEVKNIIRAERGLSENLNKELSSIFWKERKDPISGLRSLDPNTNTSAVHALLQRRRGITSPVPLPTLGSGEEADWKLLQSRSPFIRDAMALSDQSDASAAGAAANALASELEVTAGRPASTRQPMPAQGIGAHTNVDAWKPLSGQTKTGAEQTAEQAAKYKKVVGGVKGLKERGIEGLPEDWSVLGANEHSVLVRSPGRDKPKFFYVAKEPHTYTDYSGAQREGGYRVTMVDSRYIGAKFWGDRAEAASQRGGLIPGSEDVDYLTALSGGDTRRTTTPILGAQPRAEGTKFLMPAEGPRALETRPRAVAQHGILLRKSDLLEGEPEAGAQISLLRGDNEVLNADVESATLLSPTTALNGTQLNRIALDVRMQPRDVLEYIYAVKEPLYYVRLGARRTVPAAEAPRLPLGRALTDEELTTQLREGTLLRTPVSDAPAPALDRSDLEKALDGRGVQVPQDEIPVRGLGPQKPPPPSIGRISQPDIQALNAPVSLTLPSGAPARLVSAPSHASPSLQEEVVDNARERYARTRTVEHERTTDLAPGIDPAVAQPLLAERTFPPNAPSEMIDTFLFNEGVSMLRRKYADKPRRLALLEQYLRLKAKLRTPFEVIPAKDAVLESFSRAEREVLDEYEDILTGYVQTQKSQPQRLAATRDLRPSQRSALMKEGFVSVDKPMPGQPLTHILMWNPGTGEAITTMPFDRALDPSTPHLQGYTGKLIRQTLTPEQRTIIAPPVEHAVRAPSVRTPVEDAHTATGADGVFAVSSISRDGRSVEGGTGWAVAHAQDRGLPIWVLNSRIDTDTRKPLGDGRWYTYDYGAARFVPSEAPTLTSRPAVIGSRNVTPDVQAKLQDVISRSQNVQTAFSGGAQGADTLWAEGLRSARRNVRVFRPSDYAALSEEQRAAVDAITARAARRLGKHAPTKPEVRALIGRNAFQILGGPPAPRAIVDSGEVPSWASQIIEQGDVFAPGGVPVITTNLGGVHGAGLAKVAEGKGLITRGSGKTAYDQAKNVVTFAVKRRWDEKADPLLVRDSFVELERIAKANPDTIFQVPPVGMGHGGLKAAQIAPFLRGVLERNPNVRLMLPSSETVASMPKGKLWSKFHQGGGADNDLKAALLAARTTGKAPFRVDGTHKQNFLMHARNNIWGELTSTFSALLEGKRHATTKSWGKKLPRPGHVIEFSREGSAEKVYVRVTAVVQITPERAADPAFIDEWSSLEGWTPQYFRDTWSKKWAGRNTPVHQVRFEKIEAPQRSSRNPMDRVPSPGDTGEPGPRMPTPRGQGWTAEMVHPDARFATEQRIGRAIKLGLELDSSLEPSRADAAFREALRQAPPELQGPLSEIISTYANLGRLRRAPNASELRTRVIETLKAQIRSVLESHPTLEASFRAVHDDLPRAWQDLAFGTRTRTADLSASNISRGIGAEHLSMRRPGELAELSAVDPLAARARDRVPVGPLQEGEQPIRSSALITGGDVPPELRTSELASAPAPRVERVGDSVGASGTELAMRGELPAPTLPPVRRWEGKGARTLPARGEGVEISKDVSLPGRMEQSAADSAAYVEQRRAEALAPDAPSPALPDLAELDPTVQREISRLDLDVPTVRWMERRLAGDARAHELLRQAFSLKKSGLALTIPILASLWGTVDKGGTSPGGQVVEGGGGGEGDQKSLNLPGVTTAGVSLPPGALQALAKTLGREGAAALGAGGRTLATMADSAERRFADALRMQEAPSVSGTGNVFNRLRENFYDQFDPIHRSARRGKEALATQGVEIDAADDPNLVLPTEIGGGLGRADLWMAEAINPIRTVLQLGQRENLRKLLTLDQMERAWQTADLHTDLLKRRYAAGASRGRLMNDEVGQLRRYDEIMESGTLAPGGLRREEAVRLREQLLAELNPSERDALLAARDGIVSMNRKALDRLATEGLITRQDYDRYVARGHLYTPIQYRSGSAESGVLWRARSERANALLRAKGGRLSVAEEQVIKKLQGSDQIRYAADPIEASLTYVREVAQEVARNRSARVIIGMKDWNPEMANGMIRPLSQGELVPEGFSTISHFVNGRAQTYVMPAEMADALEFANTQQVGTGLKALHIGRALLQTLATTGNIAFLLRNQPRDWMDAAMLTRGLTPDRLADFGAAWGRNVGSVLRSEMTPMRARFLEAGGDYSTITKNIDPDTLLPRRMGPIRFSQKMLNATEQATKEAAFEQLVSPGNINPATGRQWTDLEAAAEVRKFGGSPDFAQRGRMTGVVSEFVMFFNPQIQGVGRQIGRYQKDPRLLGWHMAGVTTALTALHAYNSSVLNPDTGRPAIEDVPEQERQQNLIVMTGSFETSRSGQSRPKYYRIPLGHAARLLWIPTQDAIRAASGDPSVRLDETVMDTAGAILPGALKYEPSRPIASVATSLIGGLNPVVKVPLEQAMDLNTFTQAPIVGRRLEGLPAWAQANTSTSPTMRAIGSLTGASPVRLEHAYRNVLPGPGEMALSAADWLIGDTRSGGPMTTAESYGRFPGAGPLLRPFLGSPTSQVREDAANRLFTEAARANDLVNLYRQATPEQRQALLADPEQAALLKAFPDLEKRRRAIGEIARRKDAARSAPNAEILLRDLWQKEMKLLGITPQATP